MPARVFCLDTTHRAHTPQAESRFPTSAAPGLFHAAVSANAMKPTIAHLDGLGEGSHAI